MPPKSEWLWLTTDSVDALINAAPERVYDMVADMPRMGEWSPECGAVEWIEGADGPAKGARFIGHNHTGPRGVIKWSRKGTVLAAERGREFAFATEEGGVEGTVWRYRFEPVDGGTRVTESYEASHLPLWARIGDIIGNRHRGIMKNMRHTVGQLKTAAEASADAGAKR